jgi:hypothetical protein
MADTPEDGPSLEMPSFSLRRRKKQAPEEELAPQTGSGDAPEPEPEPAPQAEAKPEPVPEPVPEPAEPKRRRERPSITLPGLPAAALSGVVVGALAVLLAWLAGVGCSAVRGTSSCGGAAGLPLLLVGLGLLAYAGMVLLRLFGVREAGSTSLLAVGILSVLVLVFLLGSTDEWWMVIAIPVTAVIAYCASWWVTTAVVGDEPEPTGARTPYDVR